MGRCYTTSATPDKQTPCAAHFPPIRSRRRSCPMCLPSHSLLDTFVLWLDRCRGSAVKCARREPTTSITDKERSGCEHPHHTHFREREKKVWQRKGMMRSFFFFILDGRCWKLYHKRQTPKNNDLSTMTMQPAGSEQQQEDKVFPLCVFSPWPRTIELLLHHSEINYCCWTVSLLLQGALLRATIGTTLRGQQNEVRINTLQPYYCSSWFINNLKRKKKMLNYTVALQST